MVELTEEEKELLSEEVYNLDSSIAQYLIPRLTLFKEQSNSTPPRKKNGVRTVGEDGEPIFLTMEEWRGLIQDMIDGFEEYISDEVGKNIDYEKVKKALDIFREYFVDLWI